MRACTRGPAKPSLNATNENTTRMESVRERRGAPSRVSRRPRRAGRRPRGVELRAEALLDATEAAPVVTPQALDRFFDSGEAARAVEALGPAFKAHVAHALTSLGVDPAALPEDDLARRLAKAAGLERAEKAPRRRPTRRRKRPAKR